MLRSLLQNIPVFDFGWMFDADADGTDGSLSHSDGSTVFNLLDKSELEMMPLKRQMEANLYVSSGINNNPVIRFDGQNDYPKFNEINTIRTVFLVVSQNSGNQGFLLGHETNYAFHPGNNSVWSDIWSSTYLLNGVLQVNGSSYDGLSRFTNQYSFDCFNHTTGMLPASSFSKIEKTNLLGW